ncbi:hypothetical protein Misp01_45560 [Microtetraspora sp. NBRC 13810]|uniref:nucleotide disphospho-sugar-binding domain-containing protein n=1 Tax=Microtetraspora sp. NBRC 13810 TaxID=3030990 RepID=UPI0024A55F2B|nr:nucleotide disphospho-sugar-binding domain-containing protein [Microtetraspora sp. NBRC 13810]GLW09427.1 hypothetical protein Misp01_45560 [Microtetraspora sp. NBRC 13810]
MVALAARLGALGAGVRVCAPPDEEFAELPAGAGVPPVPVGRVAAVVHHGGAGTTTTAARAGAPQVVVPQAERCRVAKASRPACRTAMAARDPRSEPMP